MLFVHFLTHKSTPKHTAVQSVKAPALSSLVQALAELSQKDANNKATNINEIPFFKIIS